MTVKLRGAIVTRPNQVWSTVLLFQRHTSIQETFVHMLTRRYVGYIILSFRRHVQSFTMGIHVTSSWALFHHSNSQVPTPNSALKLFKKIGRVEYFYFTKNFSLLLCIWTASGSEIRRLFTFFFKLYRMWSKKTGTVYIGTYYYELVTLKWLTYNILYSRLHIHNAHIH